MSVLVTDDFNRADGGLGANWTTIAANEAPQIRSNLVEDLTANVTGAGALYTAITWPSDQYASFTIVSLVTSSTREVNIWLRALTTEATGYAFTVNGPLGSTARLRIRRINNGTPTSLGDTGAAATVAANDVLRAEVIGSGASTTVNLYINGIIQLTNTDGTPINSGSAGISLFAPSGGTTADAQLDNFEGGDFGSITGLRPAMRVPNVLVF